MTEKKEKLNLEEQIDRYVDGQLNQKEIDELWAELIQHDEYIDYLKTSANLKEVVRERETAYAVSTGNRGWMYAAAAAIVLLLMVFGTMQSDYFNSPSDGVQPIETIELDYYRSANDSATLTDPDKVIRNALQLFNNGEFDQAVALLNNELDDATEVQWVTKLHITLGTIYYNTDKFNDAAYHFREIIENYNEQAAVLMLEKAYWYLGNSYFQMNMLEEAKITMEKAYELNGAYSRVAKSYLDAMAQVNTTAER